MQKEDVPVMVKTASAIAGKITGPTDYKVVPLKSSITVNQKQESGGKSVKLLNDFHETDTGKLVYCPQNNWHTDDIVRGK